MQNIDFMPVVRTIGTYDDGSESGEALFVGGEAVGAPGGGNFLGEWRGCPPDSILSDRFISSASVC